MIVEPKVKGFICTTAHPVGCAHNVEEQVDYVKAHDTIAGCKNALIIGSSTGYGLATRIVAAFGCQAKTIGVHFERPAQGKRTASAGWYNAAAFESLANAAGLYAKNVNGDAFSDELKQRVCDLIREDLGQIDLLIYSLASPRRNDPRDGKSYTSVLKPVGETFTNKTVDPIRGIVKEVTIAPAEGDDIHNTVKVMGGEDWQWWVEMLQEEGLLADGIKTLAYSYIGPELTHAVYKEGTIGKAKDHLQQTAHNLQDRLKPLNGQALISVNKALVTQASSAIPVVPLYMSILFRLMKTAGTHEGCIEQMYRLFHDFLYNPQGIPLDDQGRIRIDDLEMDPAIQSQIADIWAKVDTDNLEALTDIEGYRHDFYRLFGFDIEEIDYQTDVNVDI